MICKLVKLSIFLPNKSRVTDVGNKHGYQGAGGRGCGQIAKIGIDIYTLLYIK